MYKINIIDYFKFAVEERREYAAVEELDRGISFEDIYSETIKVAVALRKLLKNCSGLVIAVYMSKSIETVIADLAIMYSGNAYMNLDVKTPRARTDAIIAHVCPSLIIISDAQTQLSQLNTVTIQSLLANSASDEEKEELSANLATRIDTDLACLINTSGSTGIPKTVALNHRSFIDFTEAVFAADLIRPCMRIGSLSPVIFDIFSFELCLMLSTGATLVLIPEQYGAFPAKLLELLGQKWVEFIFWVPTIMVNIANMDLLNKFVLSTVRIIWFAGEVFPTSKFNYWRRHMPWATFANLYGPIEITLDCLYHVIERDIPDSQPIPIGKPFRNTSILVLSDDNTEITSKMPMQEGELCVRGSSLAMGYYNDPEKTAAAFTQNPLNKAYPELIYRTGDVVCWNEYGELIFKGRRDSLIKHHGYRIELAEIEHMVLNADIGVDNCCVFYDNGKIVLVYEAIQKIAVKQLARDLQGIMPRYMVPQEYLHYQELPRNINGKIDRNQIRQLLTDR